MSIRSTLSVLGVASTWALLASAALSQGCPPAWQPTFGDAAAATGHVQALAVFDDGLGDGPALYAAGADVSRWDGENWSPIGTLTMGSARALAVHDDGSGGGPALYVGGGFMTAGGVVAHRVAKWDGASWSSVGTGLNSVVEVLAVFDDGRGDGPQLYAGGWFTAAGGVTVNHVAMWNGAEWRALGEGINGINVLALAGFDDGQGGGPALYVGGAFTGAGGLPARNIARWDGSIWSALGGHGPDWSGGVFSLADLSGLGGPPRLCVGGSFWFIGELEASKIAVWDGAGWSTLGAGMYSVGSGVHALALFDDGSGDGPALYAGGKFVVAGRSVVNGIAKWDGADWSPLGSGVSDTVYALQVFDDGSGGGPALFAGGNFEEVFDSGDSFIAKWGCSLVWEDLGSGLEGVAGIPSLIGMGSLVTGSPGFLTLSSAMPTTLTNLFVSFASNPTPFKSGTLVPVPPAVTLGLFTDSAGSIQLAWPDWPAGVPSGTSLYFQYAIADLGAPAGVSLSNALHATTP